MPRSGGKRRWSACVFRAGRTIAGETRSDARMAGEGPRATVCKTVSFHRRARACPSPCLGQGNGVGWRSIFARVERSRGTGPRATGQEGSPLHTPFGIRRSRTTVSCSNLANLANLVNPAHIFNLTKSEKNSIINTMFNSNLIFHINLKEANQ